MTSTSPQVSPVPSNPQTPATQPPSASLYVGDLSPDVSEGMLYEVFNSVGIVSSIRVCRDTLTKRSLGYAYVNFHSVNDAERALDTLNNHIIQGRPCRIMWSQRDPSIRKTGVGNIFIKNLDPLIGHKELYDTFSAFGNILSCKVAHDERGVSKGYGFVHFENQSCAESAVQHVHDNMLLSKRVYVGPFIPRKLRAQQMEKSWTNVFIKDIDPAITDSELTAKFSQYGTVTSAVIMRNDDGTSLGFGFANYSDHESAVAAVKALHGERFGNKVLFCCRAQKKAEREARLKKEWEMMKIQKYQGINLYIKNIEDEIDEEKLKKEFSAFGTIKSCKIMTDEKGNSRGFGFVCFAAPEESQRAISEMNNRILPGCTKPLYVALHEPKEVRRHKLAATLYKGLRANVPQGGPVFGPTGQPVYYPAGGNLPQGFVYPPQQMMASMPRWQAPQYPLQYSNAMGSVVPRSSPGGSGNSSRGRGAGTSRGRTTGGSGNGGARRNNNSNNNVQNVPLADQNTTLTTDFSLAQVKQFSPEQQKLILGERLYSLIVVSHPQLAGKITGMFLDSGWAVEELFAMIGDREKLQEKIEDAINVLERAQHSLEGEASEQ